MGDALPTGVILMWSGSLGSIPVGWALCDGTSGTPNLLGRFVRGIDTSSSNPGSSGGADQYTLSVGELPSHSHEVTDPGHSHSTTKVCTSGPTTGLTGVLAAQGCGSLGTSHNPTGISLASAGGGAAFDNRPAYYEVAYIIKL